MRAWIYDRAIVKLTSGWYREVLSRLPQGSRLLDVGVGTGGALCSQAALVRQRDLRVVGVDIDGDYVKRARARVAKVGLADRVEVLHEPLQAHAGAGYDAVYFAASFMLFPDPVGALRIAATKLAPDGRVFFTQTFHEKRSGALEKIKPMLKAVTSIDFGRVTYEADFLATLAAGDYEVLEQVVLGRTPTSTYRMIVARPRG